MNKVFILIILFLIFLGSTIFVIWYGYNVHQINKICAERLKISYTFCGGSDTPFKAEKEEGHYSCCLKKISETDVVSYNCMNVGGDAEYV